MGIKRLNYDTYITGQMYYGLTVYRNYNIKTTRHRLLLTQQAAILVQFKLNIGEWFCIVNFIVPEIL